VVAEHWLMSATRKPLRSVELVLPTAAALLVEVVLLLDEPPPHADKARVSTHSITHCINPLRLMRGSRVWTHPCGWAGRWGNKGLSKA
jgi:hypothetical protein